MPDVPAPEKITCIKKTLEEILTEYADVKKIKPQPFSIEESASLSAGERACVFDIRRVNMILERSGVAKLYLPPGFGQTVRRKAEHHSESPKVTRRHLSIHSYDAANIRSAEKLTKLRLHPPPIVKSPKNPSPRSRRIQQNHCDEGRFELKGFKLTKKQQL